VRADWRLALMKDADDQVRARSRVQVLGARDIAAAVPLLSATTLAKGLDLAVKNAIRLLDGLVAAGVAIEVAHRSKRRLFGLKGMAPRCGRPPLLG
jgi:hypothetical protein